MFYRQRDKSQAVPFPPGTATRFAVRRSPFVVSPYLVTTNEYPRDQPDILPRLYRGSYPDSHAENLLHLEFRKATLAERGT
jgi:hypothetical protein